MRHSLPRFLLVLFFLSTSSFTSLAAQTTQEVPTPPAPIGWQLVRISYVQGAVKISTGLNGAPDLGKDWVVAGVNFPIEEGATLATEEGRAEVEFENGSMIYLAEHSVLQFRRLRTTSNGTDTKVVLAVGRATFALVSNGHDDFALKTNANVLHLNSAKTFRVESALDGATFHVVEGSFQFSPGLASQAFSVGPGGAFQCVNGALSPLPDQQDDPDQTAWDQWVSDERAARKADIDAALKQSGLTAPIPGIVDLARAGKFTECAPYGSCWVLNPPEPDTNSQLPAATPPTPNLPLLGKGAQQCDPTLNPGVSCHWVRAADGMLPVYEGPCGLGPLVSRYYWLDQLLLFTPQNPKGQVVAQYWGVDYWGGYGPGFVSAAYPSWWGFPWATCHAGSWVPDTEPAHQACKKEKVEKSGKCLPPKKWVVGPKRKGGSFVRVRLGKTEGYIPKHPLDTKGKPLLNAQDGILTFHGKGADETEEMKSTPKNLQIVKGLPSGYESNWVKTLPKAEQPIIQGRLLTPLPGFPSQDIHFDYKTKTFVAGSLELTSRALVPVPAVSNANGKSSHSSSSHASSSSGSSASASKSSSHGNLSSHASSHSSSSSSNSASSRSYSGSSSSRGSSSYSGGGESRSAPSAPPPPSTSRH